MRCCISLYICFILELFEKVYKILSVGVGVLFCTVDDLPMHITGWKVYGQYNRKYLTHRIRIFEVFSCSFLFYVWPDKLSYWIVCVCPIVKWIFNKINTNVLKKNVSFLNSMFCEHFVHFQWYLSTTPLHAYITIYHTIYGICEFYEEDSSLVDT